MNKFEHLERVVSCQCGNDGWWINDGHGIPLAVVCDSCKAQVLKGFRSDIMSRYECDEPIEPDWDWGEWNSGV